MPRKGVSKETVFKVADNLAKAGKLDSITIRLVRELIGTGSRSTIQAHLNAWWQDCFDKKQLFEDLDNKTPIAKPNPKKQLSEVDVDFLVEQIHVLEQQTEQLVAKLQNSEQARLESQETIQTLESQLKQTQTHSEQQQAKLNSIEDERKAMLEALVKDKDKLIRSLRVEIKALNQDAREEMQQLGHESDELLLSEKVKTRHLEEQVKALQKLAQKLEKEAAYAERKNAPLKRRLNQQKQLIDKFISFEQLSQMEALSK